MAKYSKFDQRNKKKSKDKYRSDRKLDLARQKQIMKESESYYETNDLSSVRGWQKI